MKPNMKDNSKYIEEGGLLFTKLCNRDKKVIENYFLDMLENRTNELQKLWLKYTCIELHDNFGFDEEQCLSFLVAWKRIVNINRRYAKLDDVEKAIREQKKLLDEKLSFFKDGYPEEWANEIGKD